MYWYYFQSARGVRVWWKQWITRLQIAQFVIDLGMSIRYLLGIPVIVLTVAGFIYFASYTYFTSTYWPHIPNAGKCAGEEYAAYSGVGVISSYLFLFVSFYFATYSKGGKSATKKTVANGTNGVNGVGGAKVNVNVNGNVRSRKA